MADPQGAGTATAERPEGDRRAQRHQQQQRREGGIIPRLARAAREVEGSVQRGAASRSARAKLQAAAMLVREERARVKADAELGHERRAEELKRLDGVALILGKAASRDPSLLPLLGEGAPPSAAAQEARRTMLQAAGIEVEPEPEPQPDPVMTIELERQVVPASVEAQQLANPFLAPDLDTPRRAPKPDRLAGFDLLDPLFHSFEYGADGTAATMDLPDGVDRFTPRGLELMRHQAQLVGAVSDGHRSFLLADEPGLGKTAQALLAAEAADAFPLLVVSPSVVKMNWAREAERWIPNRTVSIVQGDGARLNGFADVIVINYEVLDRHVGWLRRHGFEGLVVDEAHFIKNTTSKRSRFVLDIASSIRDRHAKPLLMALTGTPLINDIEDFRAIWQLLGWIDGRQPNAELTDALEATHLTPMDAAFYRAARHAVVDMGIVRRRKVDVASDIPARTIADLPVELDDAAARSIREAERELAARLVQRYDRAVANRAEPTVGIDHDLVRRIATSEVDGDDGAGTGENVFRLVRQIGTAKAALAADYAAQLARSVGKVVLFAKHVDAMDIAERTLAERGLKTVSIRGDQSPTARQAAIDAFVGDDSVAVAVCSLTAAGIGINLQVASNMVLAELSWTDAEQTQAIDRIHRIGQSMPVTVWRIIAAHTVDTRIAELLDSKAGLAQAALDGVEQDATSVDMRLETLVGILEQTLRRRGD